MNEQTVFEVPDVRKDIEREYTQGLVTGLYLPMVYKQNKKRAVARKVRRIVSRVFKTAASMVVGSLAGFITAAWAIPVAYEYRGYDAVGGEWILIIGVTMVAVYYSSKFLNRRDKQ